MKRLGGEVGVRRPRKRLFLSRSRCVLAASSCVSLAVAIAVYVAAIPGFTPPSTYRFDQVGNNHGKAFASLGVAKDGAASQQSADQAGVSLLGGAGGDGQSAGLLASIEAVARTTVEGAASQASESSGGAGDAGSSSSGEAGSSSSSKNDGDNPSAPGGSGTLPDDDSSNSGAADEPSLSPAEEAEFHDFLVAQFNDLGNMISDEGNVAGRLELRANEGYYGDAPQWYSSAASNDGTIDSIKVQLNRKISVASNSRYYRAWEELQLCCNDLGVASVSLLQGWGYATSADPNSKVSQMLSCASEAKSCVSSAFAHQSSARGLL